MINFAIIGAGLVGVKRAKALVGLGKLLIVGDSDVEKAQKLAQEYGSLVETDWRKIVVNPKIQAIIISTPNNLLSIIGAQAILNGKAVLIEKPGGRNLQDLSKLIKAWKKRPTTVMFGYNHRYHPAILQAKKIVKSGQYGEVMFIRAKYGHGGRIGYEKEWRFQKELSGGGELIDQGSHLVDLVNYLVGPMDRVWGKTAKFFWKSKVEDSAFLVLSNKKNQLASLSVSCVEWKNIFSFEIMLERAKIQIDGLGRSYGTEKLTLYKMKPELGPPDVEEFVFEGEDLSWVKELKVFINKIKTGDSGPESLIDAKYVLKMIEQVYSQNL